MVLGNNKSAYPVAADGGSTIPRGQAPNPWKWIFQLGRYHRVKWDWFHWLPQPSRALLTLINKRQSFAPPILGASFGNSALTGSSEMSASTDNVSFDLSNHNAPPSSNEESRAKRWTYETAVASICSVRTHRTYWKFYRYRKKMWKVGGFLSPGKAVEYLMILTPL